MLTGSIAGRVWVVMTVDGEQSDVVGVSDTEELARKIGEATGSDFSVKGFDVSHPD